MAHTQGGTWKRRQLILQCTIWMCASPFENHHLRIIKFIIWELSMATYDGDKRELATSPRCAFLKGKEKSLEWWLQSHCFSLVGVWGGSLSDYIPTSLVCGYPCIWAPLLVDGLPCYGHPWGWAPLWMTFVGGLPCGWALPCVGSLAGILTFLCSLLSHTATVSFSVVHIGTIKLISYTNCKPRTIILFSNLLGHISETFKIIFIYLWEFYTNILIISTLHFPFSPSPGLLSTSFFQFYDLFLLSF